MKKFVIVITLVILAGVGGYAFKGRSRSTSDSRAGSNVKTGSKSANFSGKDLTSFPNDALNDISITELDVSHNNLTGSLPGEIRKLSNLETLDVSNNKMTGIPAEIGQLKNLKVLNYANNQITGLPLELGNLTQLQVLDLRGNNPSQQDLSKIRVKLPNTEIKL